MAKNKFIVASIIPTGIRCSIGGYIGDATLVTNKIAGACDYLITNPNAVNAGAFNFKEKNVLYVEGATIDSFFEGKVGLALPQKNTVGVILEKIDDKVGLQYALKAMEAYSEVGGVDIGAVEYIPPIQKKVKIIGGQFCADIPNIEPLLRVAKKLLKRGASALAISTHIPASEKILRQYQRGRLPNPYGFLEALYSHAVSHIFNVPAAHAPILTKKELDFYLFNSFESDPRSAFENISGAYIGSVLLGLDMAPRTTKPGKGAVNLRDINVLIVPVNCLRSTPVAQAMERGIPIIQVLENKNIFRSMGYGKKVKNIIDVSTYDDAAKEVLRIQKMVE